MKTHFYIFVFAVFFASIVDSSETTFGECVLGWVEGNDSELPDCLHQILDESFHVSPLIKERILSAILEEISELASQQSDSKNETNHHRFVVEKIDNLMAVNAALSGSPNVLREKLNLPKQETVVGQLQLGSGEIEPVPDSGPSSESSGRDDLRDVLGSEFDMYLIDVVVPNLVGSTYEIAVKELKSISLRISTEPSNRRLHAHSKVVFQSPAAGVSVPSLTEVLLRFEPVSSSIEGITDSGVQSKETSDPPVGFSAFATSGGSSERVFDNGYVSESHGHGMVGGVADSTECVDAERDFLLALEMKDIKWASSILEGHKWCSFYREGLMQLNDFARELDEDRCNNYFLLYSKALDRKEYYEASEIAKQALGCEFSRHAFEEIQSVKIDNECVDCLNEVQDNLKFNNFYRARNIINRMNELGCPVYQELVNYVEEGVQQQNRRAVQKQRQIDKRKSQNMNLLFGMARGFMDMANADVSSLEEASNIMNESLMDAAVNQPLSSENSMQLVTEMMNQAHQNYEKRNNKRMEEIRRRSQENSLANQKLPVLKRPNQGKANPTMDPSNLAWGNSTGNSQKKRENSNDNENDEKQFVDDIINGTVSEAALVKRGFAVPQEKVQLKDDNVITLLNLTAEEAEGHPKDCQCSCCQPSLFPWDDPNIGGFLSVLRELDYCIETDFVDYLYRNERLLDETHRTLFGRDRPKPSAEDPSGETE